MMYKIFFLVALVIVSGEYDEDQDVCEAINCVGAAYECIGGRCYCADGFTPDRLHGKCIQCPDIGEACHSHCCSREHNVTLHCWRGVCQQCYDPALDYWMCRSSFNELFLTTTAQIAMSAVLVLGILATFALIYKLCAVATLRPLGYRSENRLSIGSLQIYVDERLRNAPPRYSRTAPRVSSNEPPPLAFINNGFIHDNSTPPPPYTIEEHKAEDPSSTIHI